MGEFIWKERGKLVSHKTDSHSEDIALIRKLSNEGKRFTYKKFGKVIHYSG